LREQNNRLQLVDAFARHGRHAAAAAIWLRDRATASCSQCEIAHGTERRDARYFAPVGPSVGKPVASIKGWPMIPNEPNAEVWRRLFSSLTGNSAVDAAVVREFCEAHGVTPAQVMAEMHNHRRIAQQGE
jgi:hypothetical protein